MRVLRVLGIAENGAHLVCVDTEPGEDASDSFALPIDDRLRAAVRGDLSRFGQLEIEMEPQLRPREIQSRIRAGASVEQVAAAAGCTPQRIERYAYPVLMERTTIAQRARRTHPLRSAAMGSIGAANAQRTLEEIVAGTLADRGQQQEVTWDAFRDERGWTVTVTWRAGRSENRAEWAYHSGPDGGSVTARNQDATDLVEPAPKPLRTVGDESLREGLSRGGDGSRGSRARRAVKAGSALAEGRRPGPVEPTEDHRDEAGAAPAHGAADASSDRHDAGRDAEEYLVEGTVTDERSGAALPGGGGDDDHQVRATGTTGAAPAGAGAASTPARSGDGSATGSRAARRGHRPPMPSWEDVLLGTRASGR